MDRVTLSKGQSWGYGRCGRRGSRPVLVHHGLVGDAAFGSEWDDLAQRHGLEWIMFERPGYGQTAPMRMQQLADWPQMISPVLEAIGLEGSFDVVGMSAGAPYAYACAAGMPERVRRVAILSGVPFIHASDVLAAYPPDGQAAYARYANADEAELRAEFRAFCQQAVAQIAADGEISAERMRNALQAVLDYDAAGPAREARLQALDWGFEPSAIQCPVDIWHFEGDPMVPFEAVQRSADQLPAVHRYFSKGEAHIPSLEMLESMATILAE